MKTHKWWHSLVFSLISSNTNILLFLIQMTSWLDLKAVSLLEMRKVVPKASGLVNYHWQIKTRILSLATKTARAGLKPATALLLDTTAK